MTTTTPFADIKTKQQKIWSSGDYGKIAWLTVPLAETLCAVVDPRPGAKVLDVATGTGHVAITAARRFCDVTGIDYVPALVAAAQRRAQAEDLEIDFREADAEDLPFAENSFDYVLSAIGVMFTADHQKAADELVRVCRPGGRIGLANWTPTGFVGELLKTVTRHVPPPPGALPPTRWGTEEAVTELLGGRVTDLTFTTASARQRFPSADFFADFFLTHYGPTYAAAQRLDEQGRATFRADLVDLGNRANVASDGTVAADWEYRVAVAAKR
ncbi:class I SAM-dependent methyltransferase [Prauserella endophytica]|uniref:Class I SAM-dependent methyltransferase n=1 Tax=Prauserella endophytica TaxID=1592324 RepID=A0ABY2SAS0_9PSEU|nr:class I SAM-dependent methyltransferase [Prauserella endophytica]TKG72786.1 class I SAM-dependent methyltransferase [Prauserella endophytica]